MSLTNTYTITGPPGCGKTTTLSRQAQRAAETYGPNGVLIASLTRTAAAEVAGRETGIAPEQIATLHGHAYRVLDRPAIAETKLAEWNEQFPLLRMAGGIPDMDELTGEPHGESETQGDQLMRHLDLLRHRMTPRELWPVSVQDFATRWFQFCQDNDAVDFTGLIERAIDWNVSAPGFPSVLLGDEAQDWSNLEAKLFCDIWGRSANTTVVVGDMDQALYTWRAANPRLFIEMQLPPENRRLLSQSYRVPQAVHAAAMQWIERIVDREKVVYQPTGIDGCCLNLPFSARQTDKLLAAVEQDIADGHDVMILGSCSYLLRHVLAEAKRRALPFHNPYRVKRGDWNPLRLSGQRRRRGAFKPHSPVDRLAAFLCTDKDIWGEHARDCWSDSQFAAWIAHMRSTGETKVLARGVKSLAGDEGWMLPDEYGELFKLFATRDDAIAALNNNLDWFTAGLMAQHAEKYQYPVGVYRKHGGKAISERPRLVIGTIHSIKGGEADCVYVMPDLSPQGAAQWQGDDDDKAAVIRTFYVAMTRARHKLALLLPMSRLSVGRLVPDALTTAPF